MIPNTDIINLIFDNGLDRDPRILSLLNCVIKNPADTENLMKLHRLVMPKLVCKKLFGKPFKEPNELVDGQIRFAIAESSLPVGFNLDEPHILIAGQTGCGKSILLMLILGQAILQGV
jgi:hypothetical protein